MSYSRWSSSDWYVFQFVDSDRLAMWHCGDESHPSATFAQLDGIDEDALAALVPKAPRDDVGELLDLVREFCANYRSGVVE